MTITFTSYAGVADQQAGLFASFGAVRGVLRQSTVGAIPYLAGSFGRVSLKLAAGGNLISSFSAPKGLITQRGPNQLLASFSRPQFAATYALASNAAVLFGGLPAPVLTLSGAKTTLTGTLHGTTAAMKGLLKQSGVSVLRGTFSGPLSSLIVYKPVTTYMSLAPTLVGTMTGGASTRQVLNDAVVMSDPAEAAYIHALLDLFQLSDTYKEMAEALQSLTDGIELRDVAALIYRAQLLDAFLASGVLDSTAQLTVLLSDAIDFGDIPSALSQVLAALQSGLHVNLTVNTGQDVYSAWVMTPETKAFRSYSNFPFNSYAQIGGKLFAASPTGIYRLGDADNDDGAAIRARIRTGLHNFGTQQKKRVEAAYIGTTATGGLIIVVEATDKRGDRVRQAYRMAPSGKAEPDLRQHRVGIGQGFRSVYWTFELMNDEEGSDFDIHDMHLLPLVLNGRSSDE